MRRHSLTHSLTHSLSLGESGIDADAAIASASAAEAVADRDAPPIAVRSEQPRAGTPTLAGLPTYFVENRGQFDEAARFVASDRRIKTALTDRGVSFAAAEPQADGTSIWRLSAIDFVDSQRPVKPNGVGQLPGTHSYFIGQDRSKWAAGVPTFAAVQYEEVAPGVDLLVVEREGAMAYDLHVEPGADLSAVELTCHRCGELTIDSDGSLVVPTELGTLRQKTPKAWYVNPDGSPAPVACAFELRGGTRFGFRVEGSDPTRPLLVDPTLQWSTYFGGDVDDYVRAVDFDSGLVTIGGWTTTTNTGSDPFPIFPATAPPNVQVVHGGGYDAFVARLDPSQAGAAQLVFSTFLGGPSNTVPPITNGNDEVTDLQIDANGGIALVGNTDSLAFPVTANAFQTSIASPGNPSGFVAHLTIGAGPTVTLDYSTYFGATGGITSIRGLDLRAGNIITFAGTAWGGLPTTANADDSTWEGALSDDAFCARLNWTLAPANALVYSTYLSRYTAGPKGPRDYATSVAWSGGKIWVGGTTNNTNFPVGTITPGLSVFDSTFNGTDGFILRLDPTLSPGSQVEYSTFIGGSGTEELLDIDVWNGSVYACGHTTSNDFPVSPPLNTSFEAPGYNRFNSGAVDGWVIKFRPEHAPPNNAIDLRYGTYLGGGSGEFARSIKRLASMAVVVVGFTGSDGTLGGPFPTGALDPTATFDSTLDGGMDAFVTYLSWAGPVQPPGNQNPIPQQLKYSTFHGGIGGDDAWSVAVDGYDAYVGGDSTDTGLPLVGNVFDSTPASNEGWVAKWSLPSSSQ